MNFCFLHLSASKILGSKIAFSVFTILAYVFFIASAFSILLQLSSESLCMPIVKEESG